jgi:5'-nucleotidase
MVAWLTALALVAAPTQNDKPAAPRCVQIIGTNDVHGHLSAEDLSAKLLDLDTPPKTPPELLKVEQGGLPTFAGYLKVLREKYPKQTLLVDAGDLFQGTLPSNFSKGAAVIAAYNAMGYQAAALGNHEFDYGPEGKEKDLQGAIRKRLTEAHFPFLACNVFEAKTGKRPTWKNLAPSTLETINGVKVGLIGAITPETPLVTIPTNVATLDFRDPAPLVTEEAKALRKKGAQVIVLITHIGGACKDLHDPNDLSSCDAHSELFSLLDAVPEGLLDVVIAGHTHQYIAQKLKGIAVSESGYYGHSFGWVEACVDSAGKVSTTLHQPVDICLGEWAEGGCSPRESTSAQTKRSSFLGESVVVDDKLQKVLEPYLKAVDAAQEAPVGVEVTSPIYRAHEKPSPLGQMVAEGIRRAVPGAQIGLTNAGGVRADLPAGNLRFKQVFEVLPFDNHVVGLRLSGKELRSFILAPLQAGHGFPQLSGARLVIDDPKAKSGHLEMADGSQVKDDEMYLLATNDFLANGGDGAKPVVSALPVDRRTPLNTLVRDSFLAYLKTLPQPVQAPAVPSSPSPNPTPNPSPTPNQNPMPGPTPTP